VARSNEQVIEEFDKVVNTTHKELEKWLETDESKSVGREKVGPRDTSRAAR
jgi:hypothetical protein